MKKILTILAALGIALSASADEALEALNAQQTAWLNEHPWADAALTRAEQRRAERARKKEEN